MIAQVELVGKVMRPAELRETKVRESKSGEPRGGEPFLALGVVASGWRWDCTMWGEKSNLVKVSDTLIGATDVKVHGDFGGCNHFKPEGSEQEQIAYRLRVTRVVPVTITVSEGK